MKYLFHYTNEKILFVLYNLYKDSNFQTNLKKKSNEKQF